MKKINEAVVGDKILYYTPMVEYLYYVKRLTKTQIILNDYSRYNRQTGNPIGAGDFNRVRIRIATEEDEKRLRENTKRNYIRRKIEKIDYKTISLETLEAIDWALKEGEA